MANKTLCLTLLLMMGLSLSGCLELPQSGASDSDTEGEDQDPGPDQDTDGDGNETTGDENDNQTQTGDPDDDGNQTDGSDGNETDHYAPGWPQTAQAKIRPGVDLSTQTGSCTANFVFSSADNRTLYIGTASHCVGGLGINGTVNIAGINGAGRVAYCSWMHTEQENDCPQSDDGLVLDVNDFALVEIKEEHRAKVHPALLHWGGPTALGEAPPSLTKVKSYGNSNLNPSAALSPMEGYVLSGGSGGMISSMYFLRPGIWGDSGSAVIRADGQTVGILMGISPLPPGSNTITNLKPALDYMNEKTGLEVELKTWDLLASGSLP